MPLEQLLTLVIAVYGAGLSTVLAVRELMKDRRRLLIILEYVVLYERAQLTIVNVGYRPATINGIGMWVFNEQNERNMPERVPRNSLFASELDNDDLLPVTINDGEHVTLTLSDALSGILRDNNMKAKITVYDVEGREHKRFRTRLHNPKWGSYDTSQ